VKRAYLLALVILVGASCTRRVRSDPELLNKHPDVRSVVLANQAFGFELHAVLPAQGNLLFSPASIHTALAMTYAGARGETAAEMSKALHLSLPDQRLHPAFGDLTAALNVVPTDDRGVPRYTLAVANALWGQKDFSFKPEFINLLHRTYGAGFKTLDFFGATEDARRTINRWVAKRTADRIKELIPRDELNGDTRLVLTNAVYFKSTWDRPFARKETTDQPFHLEEGGSVTVPMMARQHDFRYLEEWGLQLVELPYSGGELSVIVILPPAADSVSAVEHELRSERFDGWMSHLKPTPVRVYLPRFSFRSQLRLKTSLARLGMALAFDDHQADFSAMHDFRPGEEPLYIWDVIHEAFVAVDEEGTEATAASAVQVRQWVAAAEPSEPKVFRADRPFLFVIRHNLTGEILVFQPDLAQAYHQVQRLRASAFQPGQRRWLC